MDPRALKREHAGRYVTADGRFAVQGEGAGSWYLTDTSRENELGLPLLEGPFATIDAARARIAALSPSTPAPRIPADTAVGAAPPHEPAAASAGPAADAGPPADEGQQRPPPAEVPAPVPSPHTPPEPAWMSRLAPPDRERADALLAVLARLGINDPALVRREVEGNIPEVARLLLARRVRAEAVDPWRDPHRLLAEVEQLPAPARRHLRGQVEGAVAAARRLLDRPDASEGAAALAWLVALRTVARVFAVLDAERRDPKVRDEPGWRLLELASRQEPTDRSITVDDSDLLEP